jgi:hypothetical protein
VGDKVAGRHGNRGIIPKKYQILKYYLFNVYLYEIP